MVIIDLHMKLAPIFDSASITSRVSCYVTSGKFNNILLTKAMKGNHEPANIFCIINSKK
jgi:hypothetical protein